MVARTVVQTDPRRSEGAQVGDKRGETFQGAGGRERIGEDHADLHEVGRRRAVNAGRAEGGEEGGEVVLNGGEEAEQGETEVEEGGGGPPGSFIERHSISYLHRVHI